MFTFGNVIQSLDSVVEWIENTAEQIGNIFSDVDFTLLYSYFPSDIVAVVTAVIAVLLFLALFGILRRVLFFLG